MKIKRTAVILAACMGISLLAGCGDDNQKIFEQADKDLAQGSYEYAREGYLTSVKNKVKLPLSYRGAGIASLRLGDYQDAIQNFASALACEDTGKALAKDILAYKATAEIKAGSYEDAMADCQTLIKDHDMDADTWFLAGNAALLLDSYEEAASDFGKSFDADPTYDRAIRIYGIYLDQDMEADGTTYLEAALKKKTKDSESHCDKGRIYYYMEDYDNARQELTQAANDGEEEADLLLGMVYLAQNDISNARTMFQNYVEASVGDGDTKDGYSPAKGYNGLALCDIAEGNYDSALTNISSGITVSDTDDLQSLLFNEVIAYEKKLDFASALDKAQTYVGMYPNDADGQKEVAFLKTRTGA